MAWIVGIDEAGYGPNLGPLIMSSVTCRVPQELAGADLWEVLQSAVRRHPSEADGRILIEDSKGAVLGHGLAELVRCNHEFAAGTEPVHFFVDKHGGRNTYAAMLQEAVPGGMVVAHEEGMDRSVYSVLGFGQEMRLTFQPRADSEHFCVALASMISKYLREVLMGEFNGFWRQHLPDLKPTAG